MSPTSSTAGDRSIGAIAIRSPFRTPSRSPAQPPDPPSAAPVGRADLLASFGPMLILIRWGTVALGLALAALDDLEPRRQLAWGGPLVVYSAWRTVRPLRYVTRRIESLVQVLVEVGLTLAVVVATGYWESPYVFALATAILAAGFARGFGFALRTAVTAIVAVALPYHLVVPTEDGLTTIQWATELLLVGVVGGYARRLFGEAEEQTVLARQANDLLSQLHDIAQTLPSSLDLEQTIDDTIRAVRQHLEADTLALLLPDPTGGGWTVARSEGVRLAAALTESELPRGAVRALDELRPARSRTPPFLTEWSKSAVHLPLVARGRLVGLLIAEQAEPSAYDELDTSLVEQVLYRAALALDNARWFTLLRRVGADEERTRIARDLHDRVGQSLAFVGFELDRISRQVPNSDVGDELKALRQEVTSVVSEVRDTLYDLRTDVTEERGMVPTLAEYLERVRERAGMTIDLDHAETVRLPLRQEREVWRIAQEAVTNAVRHSGASKLWVRWYRDDRGGLLEIRDDGSGLSATAGTRQDAYGVRGMRERAAAIGARLTIGPAEGGGTLVRCEVPG